MTSSTRKKYLLRVGWWTVNRKWMMLNVTLYSKIAPVLKGRMRSLGCWSYMIHMVLVSDRKQLFYVVKPYSFGGRMCAVTFPLLWLSPRHILRYHPTTPQPPPLRTTITQLRPTITCSSPDNHLLSLQHLEKRTGTHNFLCVSVYSNTTLLIRMCWMTCTEKFAQSGQADQGVR